MEKSYKMQQNICNELNKRARRIFVLCRVEFSKIGKRDVTFIREMRVDILNLICKMAKKTHFQELPYNFKACYV